MVEQDGNIHTYRHRSGTETVPPQAVLRHLLADQSITPDIRARAERVLLDLTALERGAGKSAAFRAVALEEFDKLAAMLREVPQ